MPLYSVVCAVEERQHMRLIRSKAHTVRKCTRCAKRPNTGFPGVTTKVVSCNASLFSAFTVRPQKVSKKSSSLFSRTLRWGVPAGIEDFYPPFGRLVAEETRYNWPLGQKRDLYRGKQAILQSLGRSADALASWTLTRKNGLLRPESLLISVPIRKQDYLRN